jgi:hypothetical protein
MYVSVKRPRNLSRTNTEHTESGRSTTTTTTKFNSIKLLLENSLRNDRKQRYKQLMSSLCNRKMCSEAIWRTVRKFHNKRVKQALPKRITYGNITATTTQEIADVFADYFEKEVYAKTADTTAFHQRITQQVTDKIEFNRAAQQLHTWNPITIGEVKWTMKQLRSSSPGPDNVHNRCLKNYTDLLLQFITTLFNAVIDWTYSRHLEKGEYHITSQTEK